MSCYNGYGAYCLTEISELTGSAQILCAARVTFEMLRNAYLKDLSVLVNVFHEWLGVQ